MGSQMPLATTKDRIYLEFYVTTLKKNLREKVGEIYFLTYVFNTILLKRKKTCNKIFAIC